MRILFLVYHGFSDYSGISKKIHYQVKGLREGGHDVRLCYYDFDSRGHRCRFVDGTLLQDCGKGLLAAVRQRVDYRKVYDYCVDEGIELVYARCFQNASPWLTRLFRRLKTAGIHAVTEIPTYPYDDEFRTLHWTMRLGLKVDQLFRNSLYREMDAVVTFSDADVIFGQRTIRISNGVDFDSIPLHNYHPSGAKSQVQGPNSSLLGGGREGAGSELHLIGVAEVHPWHAFDRVMTGIGEYYAAGGGAARRDVVFHVVGGVHENHMNNCFRPIIERYGLHDRIVFHGQLFGDALTDVFNQCRFAIGSLGRHRSGITAIKTLKNREYATRGIPFVYSEQDSDFDGQPYVVKAPADESPLDIGKIIDFCDRFTMSPAEIRKTVEHLAWSIQMQRVIDAVLTLKDKSTQKPPEVRNA